TVYAIDIAEFDSPKAVIDVRCSKGTYIRTLSEDIAKHIGTFAHLTALRRTETAGFTIAQSHTLEALANLDETERDSLLLPCDVLVAHFPQTVLNDYAVHMLQCGQRPRFDEDLTSDTPVRVYTENGRFVGLAEYQKEICRLKALRLMNTAVSAA
ncbi:tRNA pseudouridine(55) synthase TruB, partial [Neisseria meningitidis]